MLRRLLPFLALAILASAPAGPVRAADLLDDGTLDPSWFGSPGEFRNVEDVDYLWVKEGFSVKGRTIWVQNWEPPKLLGKKRDGKDSARAFELTERMPGLLTGALTTALGEDAKISRTEGDVVVVGRFVDINAGSKTAKWLVGMGAGSASATWDMKIVDKNTGELLVAIHHRCISGTAMSEIDDKIVKWLDERLIKAQRAGLYNEYAAGKKAKK